MIPLVAALLLLAADQFDRPAVPDSELADQRGGFRLPGGIDVALTVDTITAVDGAVVLRTVFRADQGPSTLSIYAPRPGEMVAAPGRSTQTGAAVSPATTVTYDARHGIQVSTAAGVPVALIGSRPVGAALPAGLQPVAAGAVTDAGTVSAMASDGVRRVTLTGADLSITHLAGTALGAAIANTASDRTIDTQTSIAIDLAKAGPDVVGSAMLRAQDLADQAVRGRF